MESRQLNFAWKLCMIGTSYLFFQIVMKICRVCIAEKDESEFYPHRKDGLSSWCKTCVNANSKKWRANNKERYAALRAAWNVSNPNYNKEWYEANAERVKRVSKAWQTANPERLKENNARWKKNNPVKRRKQLFLRDFQKAMATPKWANPLLMFGFYEEAFRLTLETGIRHEVDHVVPLSSKLVCGLHVEHNLQVITNGENCRKSNIVWPDMPEPLSDGLDL